MKRRGFKFKNERNVITDTTEIQVITRDYGQLDANKLDNPRRNRQITRSI